MFSFIICIKCNFQVLFEIATGLRAYDSLRHHKFLVSIVVYIYYIFAISIIYNIILFFLNIRKTILKTMMV